MCESITFYSQSVKKHHLKRKTYISLLSANYIVTTITIVFGTIALVTFVSQCVGIHQFHREFDEFTGRRAFLPRVEISTGSGER